MAQQAALTPRPEPPIAAAPTRGFPLQIVGEASYMESFAAICGPRGEDGVNLTTEAVLVHDDTNRYDPQAVVVTIDGHTVGYLDRITARAFRGALSARGLSGRAVRCEALIRGGWDNGCGDSGNYGVRLALDLDSIA